MSAASSARSERDRPSQITVTESEEQTTIRVEGDLDAARIARFREAAFTVTGARPKRLLLDLSAVPFVDTAGLAALVTVARVAQRLQVPVAVRPSPQLRRVIQVTRLTQILAIAEPDEAGE